MGRIWIGIGSLMGLTMVAMAALAAHGLTPEAARLAESGVQIQGWHALALLAVGLWSPRGGMLAHAAGVAFVAGTLLFCGAVYALALTGVSLGAAAPAGGFVLMVGWGLLGASTLGKAGALPRQSLHSPHEG